VNVDGWNVGAWQSGGQRRIRRRREAEGSHQAYCPSEYRHLSKSELYSAQGGQPTDRSEPMLITGSCAVSCGIQVDIKVAAPD
jgi:hypothetical protein